MSPQKLIAKIKAFIQEDRQRAAIVGGILLLSLIVIFIFINEGRRRSAEAQAELTPTVSPTDEPEPTEEPEEETEEEEEEIEPTSRPRATTAPTAKPAATNTPGPTSTPTSAARNPNPPRMNITHPTEGQTIEFTSSSQTLCVADFPAGGDTSGLQRKRNINNGGWTNYETPTSALCYEPKEGSNTLTLQYRNSYGEESGVYHINFTFRRVSPTSTTAPSPTP